MNRIVHGDNLAFLRSVPSACARFIYIDAPGSRLSAKPPATVSAHADPNCGLFLIFQIDRSSPPSPTTYPWHLREHHGTDHLG